MPDDVHVEIEPADDPNAMVRQLIERFLADLGAIGMERTNAAQLMVIQGAIRLDKLADLEAMQRWLNPEVADWQEATDDDGEEAADAGDAIHRALAQQHDALAALVRAAPLAGCFRALPGFSRRRVMRHVPRRGEDHAEPVRRSLPGAQRRPREVLGSEHMAGAVQLLS